MQGQRERMKGPCKKSFLGSVPFVGGGVEHTTQNYGSSLEAL